MKTKSLFLSMLAMAGMLAATSCQQDELLGTPTGDYVNATFTIDTPNGIATRATIGNGEQADVVTCAVFNAAGEELTALRQTVAVSGKKATYETRLVKGQEYRVVFFAYNKAAAAYDVSNMTDIKVLGNQACNIETRDAFTNFIDVEASTAPINENVTLYRPFAQLNIGAYSEDIEAAAAAGIVVTNSQVKVSNVYTAFNAYDNVVAGETSEVTFALNGIPTEELEVDINRDETISDDEKFEYLALNYLLVGDLDNEKSLTDVEFVWQTADGKTNEPVTTFKNIPVQRNYRTNIIGYILTNPAQFNIVIDEQFTKPDYIVSGPWDGVAVSEPVSTATEYLISTPAEWVWLKGNKKSGMNIKLVADLDFGGYEVKGLGFTGTFDGQEHTMSNMSLLCGGSYYSNGLFQGDGSGEVTVQNVTLENIVAECALTSEGYVGAIFGDIQENNVTLTNVHVKNADLCGVQSVGGLVGFVSSGSTLTLNNCSVSGSYLHNYAVAGESGFVAGLAGRPVGTVTATDCKVESTTIDAYYAPIEKRGENSIQAAIGGQESPAGVTVSDDVVVTKTSMDNVVLVSTAEELGKLSVTDKVVLLTADVDFGGAAMPNPIQIWDNSTFDGQGHKISNVETAVQGGYATSLFRGDANGGNKIVKNLVVENLTASASTFASAIWSDLQNGANIEIENVDIYNASIQSEGTIGGFVGFVGSGSTNVTIKNSSINNSNLNGGEESHKRGAVVGRAYGCAVTCDNVIVDNVKINDATATTSTLVGDKGYTGTVTVK